MIRKTLLTLAALSLGCGINSPENNFGSLEGRIVFGKGNPAKDGEVILNEVEISSTCGYTWPTPIDTIETNSKGNYSFRKINLKGEESGIFSVNVLSNVKYVEIHQGETETLNFMIR